MQARLAAGRDALKRDALSQELCNIVETSKLDSRRKSHACKVIQHACERLNDGNNPLDGLRPPPSCAACAGNVHGTHHFLCLGRKLEPGAIERKVRQVVLTKLGSAWRKHQYEVQSVSARCSKCVRLHDSRWCV